MKTALITGASGGIGYELAKLCANDGLRVVLVARSANTLASVAAELTAAGAPEAIVLAKDLSEPHAPHEIAAELQARRIDIDVLINNAGFALYGKFAELSLDEQLNVLRLNIVALTELTHRFLPGMLARGNGRILNLASTAAFLPGPLMAVYYASKAYVLSFSEALANEVRGSGVTVTCACPGATRTQFEVRAGVAKSALFTSKSVALPGAVAQASYAAMMRGKALVIPGRLNPAIVFATRLGPRGMLTRLARMLNQQR